MKFFFALLAFAALIGTFNGFALPVGHTTLTFTDPSRSNRAIPCEIYYPATLAGNDQPVYAPNGIEQYPVVVFGHGFVMSVDAYGYLQRALASNGYIAVFPTTESGFTPSHTDFAKDLAFAALSTVALNDDITSVFHQRVSANVAVSGHSMGGGAAVLSFQYNLSFKTVFTLAAAETNPSAVAAATSVNVPTVYMVGGNDCIAPLADHQLPLYEATAGCKYLVNVNGATHCQFGDYNLACTTGETFSGCGIAGIADTTQHNIVLSWLLPWLDLHLKNNAAAANDIASLEQNANGYSVVKSCSNLSTNNPFAASNVTTAMIDYGLYDVTVNDAASPYVNFTVYRVDGMPVSGGSFLNGENRLSLQKFSPGVYVLACENSRLRLTRKLINLR